MNFGSYWFSDRIVLRMYCAREANLLSAPEIYALVSDLAIRAKLPMPKVYLIPEEAPNAFATGRNPRHAAVAVTEGLLRVLDREELAAVIAHELGHIKNRDTLVMTIAGALAGALSMLADMAMWSSLLGAGASEDEEENSNPLLGLLAVLVAPFAALLTQMAISRWREFLADEAGARVCGDPRARASALRKIEGWSKRVPMSAGTPATAHMFIVNPFSGDGLASLFSTHPSTAQRIARLEAIITQQRGKTALGFRDLFYSRG